MRLWGTRKQSPVVVLHSGGSSGSSSSSVSGSESFSSSEDDSRLRREGEIESHTGDSSYPRVGRRASPGQPPAASYGPLAVTRNSGSFTAGAGTPRSIGPHGMLFPRPGPLIPQSPLAASQAHTRSESDTDPRRFLRTGSLDYNSHQRVTSARSLNGSLTLTNYVANVAAERRPTMNILIVGAPQVGKSLFINTYRAAVTNNVKWPAAPVGICGFYGTTSVEPFPNHPTEPTWLCIDTPGRFYEAEDEAVLEKLIEGMPWKTKLTLQVKKHFVDGEQLCVTRAELLRVVKETMALHGYGDSHSVFLTVLTSFYEVRVPLVVLIGGTGCTGKTSLAQQLGTRLNCNTVVNTDYLIDLIDAAEELLDTAQCPLCSLAAVATALPADEADALVELCLRNVWRHQCHRVQPALTAEVEKALVEGKVLVAEGTFLNLALYQPYFSLALQEARHGIVLGFYLRCPPESQEVECLCPGGGARSNGFFARMAPLYDSDDAVGSLLNAFAVVEQQHDGDVRAAFPHQTTLSVEVDGEGQTLLTGGQEVTGVSLYHVDILRPADIPAVADALHDIILDRILEELARRGRLDDETYRIASQRGTEVEI